MSVVVSIIMPMKNAEDYVNDTVVSILNQTFEKFELIIIDDGSIDASLASVESFSDCRIKIIQGKSEGISAALNLGLGVARGKYICRCDADDLFPVERLKVQVDWLESHIDYIAISGKFSSMDEKNRVISKFNTGDEECDITQELLSGKTRTTLCAFLIKRSVVDSLKGFRNYFITAEDIDMQLRLAEQGSIGYIPENMYYYRIHNSSITHVQSSNKRVFYESMARAFLKQRLETGQDQYQNGMLPEPPIFEDKPKDSVEQIVGYMIAESWRLHANRQKKSALVISMRACRVRPVYWPVWKNLIMLLVKI